MIVRTFTQDKLQEYGVVYLLVSLNSEHQNSPTLTKISHLAHPR